MMATPSVLVAKLSYILVTQLFLVHQQRKKGKKTCESFTLFSQFQVVKKDNARGTNFRPWVDRPREFFDASKKKLSLASLTIKKK